MKNDVERYTKEINKRLQLPGKLKKRILTELTSEIYGRLDNGENLDDVLESIGSPQEVIEELEANYENESVRFRKGNIIKLTLLSVVALCMAALILNSITSVICPQFIRPTIIGGAHGSTAIFVTYKWSAKELILGLFIKVIVLVFSLLQIFKVSKSLKHKKRV